jgi:preprotein translocase subunit SecG
VYVALVTIYVIICFFLILVVLLQQGKGADIAGAFGGGSSQTAFGARGATTFLHRLTTFAFIGFVLISFLLSILEARPKASVIGKNLPAAAAPKVPAPAPSGAAAPPAPGQAAPAAPAPSGNPAQPSSSNPSKP